tara:strand:- start:47094 stop:48062 length:969 start_codon:yes stop_codon:yes gene_type:complete
MALLDSIEEIQKYVPVRHDFPVEDLAIYIPKAARKFIEPFAGNLATELEDIAGGENTAIKNKARDLLSEALCSFSFFIGMPVLSVQISGGGFHVQSTADHSNADTFAKNEMSRAFLREAHEALDKLLLLLDANASLFTSYTEDLQNQGKELLVQNVATFQKWYNLHHSRQTFLALQPAMRQVEDQFLYSWLCADFIEHIKTTTPADNVLEVKTALQKAMVHLTVAKAVTEGQFIINENGIYLKFDRLPHEATATNVNLKINDFLLRTAKAREEAGLEYLKAARRIIEAHPDDFTQCDGVVILPKPEGNGGSTIVFNDRILAL